MSFKNNWLIDISLLSLIIGIFYFLFLGSYPLFTPDEGRYAEAAREMLATHDFITPKVNGITFLDKPILYYWLQTLAIALFGTKEWALRFFPCLFGLVGALATYVSGRLLYSRSIGLLAAAILTTSPLYFIGAHYANLDLEVAVWTSLSLLSFLLAVQDTRPKLHWVSFGYIFAALGFLTKGMIAIFFPAAIVGTFILLSRRWQLLKSLNVPLGLIIFVAITSPWYYLAQRANPDFLNYFFVTQQITRFLSAADFNNKTPFWFYFPIVALGFFPWTIFLFQAIIDAFKSILTTTQAYLWSWVIIILCFFSIPHSKIITYILPIFPALALLTAKAIHTHALKTKPLPAIVMACLISTLGMLLTLTYNAAHLNTTSTKALSTKVARLLKPDDEIVNYYKFYQDLPFYLRKRITIVADWANPEIANRDNWLREMWIGRQFQQKSDWLIDEKTFLQRWHSDKRLYVFINSNYVEQFKRRIPHYFFVEKRHDVLVVSNKPVALKVISYNS